MCACAVGFFAVTNVLIAVVPSAVTAAITAFAVGPVLVRLREPSPSQPDVTLKLRYAELAGRRFATGCGLIALAFGWTSWMLVPVRLQAPWTVLATLGVVLALIDLRTTWLPLELCRAGWLLMAGATVVSAALTSDGWLLLRGLAGGVAAGALYAVVWAVSRGGFGFGDVRFAPLIGAAAATDSWVVWIWALLLGTVVGGIAGLLLLIRGRRGAFPYAPSMLLGCYLALVWSTLL